MLAAERISSVLEVLGATLPFAVGMLLSPFPIIAVLLVLLSPSGRAGGLAYDLGRFVGVALVVITASLLTEVLTLESGSSLPSAILRILLGVALLGLAVVKWRKRPETSEEAELPKWSECLLAVRPDSRLSYQSPTRKSLPSASVPGLPSARQPFRRARPPDSPLATR